MFSIFHNNFPPRNLKLWLKGEAVLVKLQFIKLENGFTTVEMKLIGKRQMDCFAVWVYMFTLICMCVQEAHSETSRNNEEDDSRFTAVQSLHSPWGGAGSPHVKLKFSTTPFSFNVTNHG